METSFRDRYGPWAVITGASEGTGEAFAERIAAEGVNCVLIARREEPLRALAERLTAEYGVECATASVDRASSTRMSTLGPIRSPATSPP